jgi:Flp pilus assembly CpaF family ATPase
MKMFEALTGHVGSMPSAVHGIVVRERFIRAIIIVTDEVVPFDNLASWSEAASKKWVIVINTVEL